MEPRLSHGNLVSYDHLVNGLLDEEQHTAGACRSILVSSLIPRSPDNLQEVARTIPWIILATVRASSFVNYGSAVRLQRALADVFVEAFGQIRSLFHRSAADELIGLIVKALIDGTMDPDARVREWSAHILGSVARHVPWHSGAILDVFRKILCMPEQPDVHAAAIVGMMLNGRWDELVRFFEPHGDWLSATAPPLARRAAPALRERAINPGIGCNRGPARSSSPATSSDPLSSITRAAFWIPPSITPAMLAAIPASSPGSGCAAVRRHRTRKFPRLAGTRSTDTDDWITPILSSV